jgi:hypothetical protein
MNIKYTHFRFSYYLPSYDIAKDIATYNGRHGLAIRYMPGITKWKPATCGGYTFCKIYLEDHSIVWGISECSHTDVFCYRTGRDLARHRALEKFSDELYDSIFSYSSLTANAFRAFAEMVI